MDTFMDALVVLGFIAVFAILVIAMVLGLRKDPVEHPDPHPETSWRSRYR